MGAIETVVDALSALPDRERRILVAICGAPASGKSTLAEGVVESLRIRGRRAVLLPMDGFHLDNGLLRTRGLLARKGAPETFDASGFVNSMERLRSGAAVVLPRFDRVRDIAIAGAIAVDPAHEIVVVEGNYLCLDEAPWRRLTELWDFAVHLDIGRETLRDRLVRRWLDHGLSPDAASERTERNDLPNAERVTRGMLPVDLALGGDELGSGQAACG